MDGVAGCGEGSKAEGTPAATRAGSADGVVVTFKQKTLDSSEYQGLFAFKGNCERNRN